MKIANENVERRKPRNLVLREILLVFRWLMKNEKKRNEINFEDALKDTLRTCNI